MGWGTVALRSNLNNGGTNRKPSSLAASRGTDACSTCSQSLRKQCSIRGQACWTCVSKPTRFKSRQSKLRTASARQDIWTRSAPCDGLLGDDHSVQSGTAQQLIASDEELEAVVAEDEAPADASNLDVCLARGVKRKRVQLLRRVVHDLDSRCAPEQLASLVWRARLHGFNNNGLGVRAERGHAHSRARDNDVVGQTKDLLQLPSNLHLFLGVAVLLERIDMGDNVEGQLVREELRRRHLPIPDICLQTILQLGHALGTRAARSLVRRHQHLLQTVLLMQGPQCHRADGGRAVRV
mmetsp:Transcript_69318/g.198805  ORF Transcript_69318/g.198805 Transcript_69318/m.198805 type:complete len:295 (-) Transcript_69318:695-1579(-)